MDIKIKLLSKDSKMPLKAHDSDAGFDLYSTEDLIIKPGTFKTVCFGISIELCEGYEAQVRCRSGLAFKEGIFNICGIGTVDSGYRGEIKTVLGNFGKKDFVIYKGDRIAQLVINELPKVNLIPSSELDSGDRGANGFGSTGI